MAIIAGADGCPGGWICVTKDTATGTVQSCFFRTAHALIHQIPKPDVLMIDIPIGLTDAQGRHCDTEARSLLRKRHVCVFSPPVRPALHAMTRVQASQITSAIDGRNVGCQAWAIYPKIREVDALLQQTPQLQSWVLEVHPEVTFREWNGGVSIPHRKKSSQGRAARVALVGAAALNAVRGRYPVKQVGHDDIADAFAALWTAERKLNKQAVSIPATPRIDSTGLRMEIWY